LTINDSNHHDDITIPLELAGCMVHFKYPLQTKEDIISLQQYFLTQGDTPWNPSSFSNQVADVFYKQVIVTDSYNANDMKLFLYDPSDIYESSIIGNHSTLTFCPEMSVKVQVVQTMPVNTGPNNSKALSTT
jgi:hypothetical protein